MTAFEYSVIPAPERGEKTKGAKTASERFSHVLTAELNRMAAEGWEYLRAEILPTEERSGLTGRTTVYHNMLVFRRVIPAVVAPENPPFTQPPLAQPIQSAEHMATPPQVRQSATGRNAATDTKAKADHGPDHGAANHIAADAPGD